VWKTECSRVPSTPTSVSVCSSSLPRSALVGAFLSLQVSPSHLSVCLSVCCLLPSGVVVVSGVPWPLWPRGCRVAGGVKGSAHSQSSRTEMTLSSLSPPPPPPTILLLWRRRQRWSTTLMLWLLWWRTKNRKATNIRLRGGGGCGETILGGALVRNAPSLRRFQIVGHRRQ